MQNKTKAFSAVVAVIMLALAVCAVPKPARADDTSSLLLGAAIGVAGSLIVDNLVHQRQEATQVVGYTPQGCPVYANGSTGCPNGNYQTVNPAGYGRSGYSGYASTPYAYGRYGAPYAYGRYYGNYATSAPYGYGRYGGTTTTVAPSATRRVTESVYRRR